MLLIYNMRQLYNLLPLSLVLALGVNAFNTSVFTFDSYYREQPILKNGDVGDVAARRLAELRMAPPDASTLGKTDRETVKLLNCLGGTPSPLFSLSPWNEIQKTTIVLEGVSAEVGTSSPFTWCQYGIFADSLAYRVFSPSRTCWRLRRLPFFLWVVAWRFPGYLLWNKI